MDDSDTCMDCGGAPTADGLKCSSCGLLLGNSEEAIEQRLRQAGIPVPADFGFVPANNDAPGFAEAEQILSDSLKPHPLGELDYSRREALENQDAYFFPVGWMGCSGHLVTKGPAQLISFGSYCGPGPHIWAYYQGIALAHLGKDRRNNLRITKIHDMDNTIRVLRPRFNPIWFDENIAPQLKLLPIEFEEMDLYFSILSLIQARHHVWFDFEITKCT